MVADFERSHPKLQPPAAKAPSAGKAAVVTMSKVPKAAVQASTSSKGWKRSKEAAGLAKGSQDVVVPTQRTRRATATTS